jgi:hypothetical protein
MKKLFWLIIIVAVLAGMWYLAKPLFFDKEVQEDLPFDISSLDLDKAKDAMTMDKLKQMVQLPEPEELEEMTQEAKMAVEKSIVEKMDKMDPVVVEEDMTEEMKTAMEEESADGPQLVKSGTFVDGDSFHKGSGSAQVFSVPNEDDLLRLENFEVTNGPDLFVYLATDESASDFVSLGELKGNQGNQNYTIPEGTDFEKYDKVLIWCRAFSVLFATAELS